MKTTLPASELYPWLDPNDPDVVEALSLGEHLIDEHGFTLGELADRMPAESGSPEADYTVLRGIHQEQHQ